jgi:hypothetical protein
MGIVLKKKTETGCNKEKKNEVKKQVNFLGTRRERREISNIKENASKIMLIIKLETKFACALNNVTQYINEGKNWLKANEKINV